MDRCAEGYDEEFNIKDEHTRRPPEIVIPCSICLGAEALDSYDLQNKDGRAACPDRIP